MFKTTENQLKEHMAKIEALTERVEKLEAARVAAAKEAKSKKAN